MNNFGFNPYLQQQQRFISPLKIYAVSNIMEANATPVENLEPIFFYNKAENVIYKKQIDSTGAAPIQTFKLSLTPVESETHINPYENDFKAINDRIDFDETNFYRTDLFVWANVKYGDMQHITGDGNTIIRYAIAELTDDDFPFYPASQRAYCWLKKHIENDEGR